MLPLHVGKLTSAKLSHSSSLMLWFTLETASSSFLLITKHDLVTELCLRPLFELLLQDILVMFVYTITKKISGQQTRCEAC